MTTRGSQYLPLLLPLPQVTWENKSWFLETATSEIRIYFQGLKILNKSPFMEPCASLPSNSFLASLINEI